MQDSSALSSGSEAAADFRGGTIIVRPHKRKARRPWQDRWTLIGGAA